MSKKKIMIVFGTRPEATKMCPVVQAFKKYPEWFDVKTVVTGQHQEQLYQVLDGFGIEPNLDLKIMKENQSLAYVTTSAINGLDDVISSEKPDLILVHGDTQTSFSAAMAAFFHKVPVGHVEAGLRSGNKYSPWPEEVNRKLIDVICDLLFAPTNYSRENLLKEGYKPETIYVTGQTAVDAAINMYDEDYTFKNPTLNELKFEKNKKVITVTAHRRENYEKMEQMFGAIRRIADENENVLFVYPVHMSPVVRKYAYGVLSNHERILLLEPIDFTDIINLMSRSYLVLSDSGGLQEECTVFHKPMILMRDTTERPEAIEAGSVYLAGNEGEPIYDITKRLLLDTELYNKMANSENPFGDGKASERIANIVAEYFGLK